jgi:hypothetical protein
MPMLGTEHRLRVVSRRRWNMIPLLPELERFRVAVSSTAN